MDLDEILNGILILIAGGILGVIGTYLVKPLLDAWLEKRKKAREAREAARRKEEEVILLLAGMLKDATQLLDGIASGRDDIFFGNLPLTNLGDSTIAPQLLVFMRDEQVEPRIRAEVADALSALDLSDLIADARALVTDEQVDPLVRGRAAHCLAQHEDGVNWLVELLEREDIGEEAYLALHRASRQAAVRVFAKPEGGYEISPR